MATMERKLNDFETEVLMAFATYNPFSLDQIKDAYFRLDSFDKLQLAIDVSQVWAVSLEDVVLNINLQHSRRKNK